jgi:hypothetical protein
MGYLSRLQVRYNEQTKTRVSEQEDLPFLLARDVFSSYQSVPRKKTPKRNVTRKWTGLYQFNHCRSLIEWKFLYPVIHRTSGRIMFGCGTSTFTCPCCIKPRSNAVTVCILSSSHQEPLYYSSCEKSFSELPAFSGTIHENISLNISNVLIMASWMIRVYYWQ